MIFNWRIGNFFDLHMREVQNRWPFECRRVRYSRHARAETCSPSQEVTKEMYMFLDIVAHSLQDVMMLR